MRLMQGLTVASLKRHPSLIPLLFCVGGGTVMAFAYLGRLATRCPDVSWDKRKNPTPWMHFTPTTQYKFWSESIDYKALKKPAERPDL